ncbi:delphilin-like isoform X2 [Mercenaria mercenaria]|uniref:delphilin-like isoform X2 n=1 Tax=Mercenaria mercenaria TaxID=6596 RepID=UPI00234E8971|nr:delphilin-like isoform X2 [Mercenaria mercenaria]
MTYSKMPLKTLKWPKHFGFEIVGQGPCFVLHVERGSVAYNSGLQCGDQILELDDQDVTNMSAEALKTLAKHSRTQPPTLGVVSRILHVDVVGNKSVGLGMVINNSKPVYVWTVEKDGPAHVMGIRPGDVIVEVNGNPVYTVNDLKPYLGSHSRRVSLSVIPLGKYSHPSTPAKTPTESNGKHVSEGSRVKRAKDLHDKMNEILGDDYEKKMAIVGVLKQYAEDRDIDMLARALSVILKTSHQRRLLRQIRPFIPPRQRIRFDDITRQQQQYMAKMKTTPEKTANGTPTASHKHGQRRALQIVRENNSFGFVIKGSNPAYIETVDPNGAAEKAGLQPGDFVIKLNGIDVRKCSHAHLVQLLQDSGTAPILEVLRCDQDEYPYSSGPQGSNSSASSTSSHAESDWTTQDNKLIVDKEGRTYLERAEFLLTSRERSRVKKAWIEYESTSNIVELFESVSAVLDTPSKKTLWMFILARLSPPHQQYCINQISLPRSILLECIEKLESDKNQSWSGDGDTTSTSAWGSRKSSIKISSFQQQVEYLLTSRERSMLKKALQLYSENRNVDNMIEDLDVILDTPSKRTLWMYIIPLLTQMHQDVVRQRVGTKQVASLQPSSDSESTAQRKSTTKHPIISSDEEHDLISRNGGRKVRSKPAAPSSLGGLDLSIIKELEETRRAVQEVKEFLYKGQSPEYDRENFKYVTVIPIERQLQEASLRSPISVQLPGQTFPVTFNSQNIAGLSPSQRLFTPQDVQRLETELFSPMSNSGSRPQHSDSGPRVRFLANFVGLNNTESDDSPRNPPSFVINGPEEESRLKIPPNFMRSGTESDQENELERRANSQLLVSKFAKMGGDTFNRHALTALKQLDAAVAAEVSDLEYSGDARNKSPAEGKIVPSLNGETTAPAPPPPPPPPPPVAPPPPAPPVPGTSSPEKSGMNVKRINWEKLDQQKVENTVWEQIGEATDLQDVVRYLELEQYFSTKSPRQKLPEKKSKICILNPKKSYNISILLGHLRLTLSEVRHALYMLDEEVLTPELLRQLLAFAPNKEEMEQLDSYNGDIEELSASDRFTYEMSRVPGYEQRLKALVFKGNFQEKITEMKEHMQNIRKASLELRHSKKLSKILELILAMGNYMNQGNQRVGEAAGFKIKFLSQLEITKTSDNKLTFLHVLAETVFNKFPELVAVGEELTTVPEAAKFSNVLLNQELQDLRKVLQDISNTLEKFGSQKTSLGINDKFQDVMGHFISQASDEIQSLFRLNANTMEEFQSTVQYFGEDPKKVTTTELFGVFAEFITKFEKAHRHNIMYKRYANL